MPREFRLPELAESVVEGEIVQWLVAEGEQVDADQPLVEVMTDKVTVELPSPYSGTLQKQLVAEGDVVPVDNPIALFSDDSSSATEPSAAASSATAASASKADKTEDTLSSETRSSGTGSSKTVSDTAESDTAESDTVESDTADEPEDDGERLSLFRPSKETDEPVFQVRSERATAEKSARGPYGRVLAVPAARKLARELGLDIATVPGSGPNGRVRVADVEVYAAREDRQDTPRKPEKEVDVKGEARAPTTYSTPPQYAERETRQPVRGLRRAIAKQMVASHLQSVRTLHVDEADVSELVAMRQRLKPLADKRGVKLSYLPLIAKATVAALKAFPMLNASLDEANNELVTKHYYNMGLAVATDAGLVVPVIREADRKSVLDIAAEVQTLAQKARDGKLAPEDTRHGTFSLTNIGSFGGLFSFPIINVPEAAILGIHSIKKRPVVLDDDRIVARQMLYLSLSFDHRVVDGAEAAQFTSYLIALLETPEALLLEA